MTSTAGPILSRSSAVPPTTTQKAVPTPQNAPSTAERATGGRRSTRERLADSFRGGSTAERHEESSSTSWRTRDRLMNHLKSGEGASSLPTPHAIESLHSASRDEGSHVDARIAKRVEQATGRALGDVRVHVDAQAQDAARSMKARAYTVGQDVYFAAGQYKPGTPDGDRLIAHELIHTVQQRQGDSSSEGKLEVSSRGDRHEHEADDLADAIATSPVSMLAMRSRMALSSTAPGMISRSPDDEHHKSHGHHHHKEEHKKKHAT
ncbi:MAG TPA: DUF4157 domain-containing protein, partial [Polyangiaceae bacterium]|nr:DUF4157 domain-containing protein [Polyangiaceae bacterium]